METIAVIGTFDSKGEEFQYLIDQIRVNGAQVLSIDIGTKGPAFFQPDITAEEVAAEGGADLAKLRMGGDAAQCMSAMTAGLPLLMRRLIAEGRIQGAVTMGGGRGTSVLRCCMAALPVGTPKILVSTMAGAGNKLLGGINDTCLIDSVVDFSGLNDILRPIIAHVGAAAAAMVRVSLPPSQHKPRIAASMFGLTTPCVDMCRAALTRVGYDFYPFHANGMGGPTMEGLIAAGFFDLVLDITTTELLQDMVVPGSGCLNRVEAAGRKGIPQIIVPGAMDSTNIFFTEKERYPGRRFVQHNAEIFLMRARAEDEQAVGAVLAEKLNCAKGKVVVVMPMGGFSLLSKKLPDPDADLALLDTLQNRLDPKIPLVTSPCDINSPEFAQLLCEQVQALLPLGSIEGDLK